MPSKKQRKGQAANKAAIEFLKVTGFKRIVIYGHPRHGFSHYENGAHYWARDIHRLWDGHCFTDYGRFVFIQIKSNAWLSGKKIRSFLRGLDVSAMSINVTDAGIQTKFYSIGEINGISQIVETPIG